MQAREIDLPLRKTACKVMFITAVLPEIFYTGLVNGDFVKHPKKRLSVRDLIYGSEIVSFHKMYPEAAAIGCCKILKQDRRIEESKQHKSRIR